MRQTMVVAAGVAFAAAAWGLGPNDVLVVVNGGSARSRAIGEYYARARAIPAGQILTIAAPDREEITREEYDRLVAAPVGAFLKRQGWVERILAIVTTQGVPLKIRATGDGRKDAAAVDSELAALYQDLHGRRHEVAGPLANPYFDAREAFAHPRFPMYLVTRLAGYTFADVRGLIDRAVVARNRGVVVLDLKSYDLDEGNRWLKSAGWLIGKERVRMDESGTVLTGIGDVIGYASWGSNDRNRKQRDVGFRYLPGAIVTEFVSTDGRTFVEPPAGWQLGDWKDKGTHFAGSPQSLSADFVRQGATGVSGHVYEPYLAFTPRPEVLFPAYLSGRTLGESYYASIPALSWMNVVVGDPLCRLR